MNRNKSRLRRKKRIRAKVFGTSKVPRLCVFRSLRGITVQVINDEKGATLTAVSLKEIYKKGVKNDIKAAKEAGKLIAKKCAKAKITEVVFDRGGYKYHGKVKALAEEARKEGLKF